VSRILAPFVVGENIQNYKELRLLSRFLFGIYFVYFFEYVEDKWKKARNHPVADAILSRKHCVSIKKGKI